MAKTLRTLWRQVVLPTVVGGLTIGVLLPLVMNLATRHLLEPVLFGFGVLAGAWFLGMILVAVLKPDWVR